MSTSSTRLAVQPEPGQALRRSQSELELTRAIESAGGALEMRFLRGAQPPAEPGGPLSFGSTGTGAGGRLPSNDGRSMKCFRPRLEVLCPLNAEIMTAA